jgi:hypothetical protein
MINQRKISMSIFVLLMIFILIGFFVFPYQSGFLLTSVREGHPLTFFSTDGKTLTIGWRHSVELQPWMEIYEVNMDGKLSLIETRFKAYGAGVPAVDGKVVAHEDGFFVIKGIQRELEGYSLFYTPNSSYYLLLEGRKYPLKDYVPADTGVHISFRDLTFAELVYIKVRQEVVRHA